ncbi:serine/threonine-protein kinase tricornered-like isoform X2 [Littorina saxatilis]|uniref:serine/threonine-protein kinase tricornered-like isoform X2 n=1 Tax=Littorina saxatilis TaxID=31220 RepID=UPI0038B48515
MTSKSRKVSQFIAPQFGVQEDGSSEAHIATKSSSSVARRRFSHDKFIKPVPPNTTAADLDFVDTLIEGSFAELIRVRRRDTGQMMVAKAFSHRSWRSEYLCSAELRVLQSVNSPWLIGYYGVIQDFDEDFLLLEFLSNGNFYQMVNKNGHLSDSQIKFYAGEMFMATNSLHEEGFMHRNIQLSNFLVHASGHLRICDFGLSYQFTKDSVQKLKGKHEKAKLQLITSPVFASAHSALPASTPSNVRSEDESNQTEVEAKPVQTECTTSYLAPEVLRLLMPKPYFQLVKSQIGYSYLCDYWALGVALYRLLYDYLPFLPDTSGCILDKVLDYHKTLTFSKDPSLHVPADGVGLVKELLRGENKRLGRNLGFREVRSHPFFSDVQMDYLGHGKVAIPVRDSEVVSTFLSPVHLTDSHIAAPRVHQVKAPTDDSGGLLSEYAAHHATMTHGPESQPGQNAGSSGQKRTSTPNDHWDPTMSSNIDEPRKKSTKKSQKKTETEEGSLSGRPKPKPENNDDASHTRQDATPFSLRRASVQSIAREEKMQEEEMTYLSKLMSYFHQFPLVGSSSAQPSKSNQSQTK